MKQNQKVNFKSNIKKELLMEGFNVFRDLIVKLRLIINIKLKISKK